MPIQNKKSIPNIIMTIDLGSSKTKIVVQELGDDSPFVLLMDAQIADVVPKSLESVPNEGLASERAWVGFSKPSSDNNEVEKAYYAVGSLARDWFSGFSQLHELKYELALPKILAAVWLASVEMSLPPRFNLNLAVLLPSGEMSDKDILKSRLASCLKDFDTPDGVRKIKLKAFQASPEGSGIYFYRVNGKSDKLDSLDSKDIICAILGFRNASAFTIRSGVSKPGKSSDLGMYCMLNSLCNSISGLDIENPEVIKTVVEGAKKPELLKKLSRKSNRSDIKADFQSISEAISVAKEEYVRSIVRWLKSFGKASEIIFCGGTAEYLRPELEKYYSNDSAKIIWHGGVSVPEEFESLLGSNRLADVWALHGKFIDLIINLNASKNKDSFATKETNDNTKENKSSSSHEIDTDTKVSEVKRKPRPYKSVVPEITVNVNPDARTDYTKRY